MRHFYNPLLKRGISKVVSNLLVFTLSAFLHEWLISGSIQIVGYHAFLSMWLQAPIIFFQKKLTKVINISEISHIKFNILGIETRKFITWKSDVLGEFLLHWLACSLLVVLRNIQKQIWMM